MEVTFHGQSCISFEANDKKVIVDPFITGNPLSDLNVEEVEADFIVLTHGHGDHLGDTIALAKRTGALVIALPELIDYLATKGVENGHPMNIGGNRTFDFGQVKFVQAFHSNSYTEEDGSIVYLGMPCGLIFTLGEKVIYHAGDTGLFSDMKLIADRHPVNLCFIPIGDNFTMGIDDASYAINHFIKPDITVPIHYDTFDLIKQDPEVFKSKVDGKVEIIQPGESVTL
ncbi:metal-dependent hydrolase [Macrococcus brunensis]|uniref:metal-dependent hydrolase n=1 Tax=Macrococcus brunensis TaxID=198483 RepID=UPI001EF0C57B|nr:metal-dependent hydrolase [Macrococcus brunensis]ULG75280.1 metal-dependent hydrolase [Macrococcus brunensis]